MGSLNERDLLRAPGAAELSSGGGGVGVGVWDGAGFAGVSAGIDAADAERRFDDVLEARDAWPGLLGIGGCCC